MQVPINTAKVYVTLPADAKLTIDGTPTVSTSESRVFESPSLTPGKTYFYVLKATVVRDGKPETVTKEVAVRAGEDTRVKIEIPETAVAE
ncbi:MAG TPA: TIGR03000 domain-containing protein [Gemmataceae bacterium]|nr:TIGR03000 domain-containing protein [Gemmataceae bacterium]